ncbi:DUF1127 domain-containing protein [Marinobacter fonticola]|uniref:hypothetical protein n=1 Tax=Marinobacter fonticola TaxID=2603215 RepID=UPI0011E6B991|nr:hypothetical protein [Marinobacter fonticola]
MSSMTFKSHKLRNNRKPRFAVGGTLNILRIWRARYRNRRALRNDFGQASPRWLARMEHDIGLEPGNLQREMNKPFWKE